MSIRIRFNALDISRRASIQSESQAHSLVAHLATERSWVPSFRAVGQMRDYLRLINSTYSASDFLQPKRDFPSIVLAMSTPDKEVFVKCSRLLLNEMVMTEREVESPPSLRPSLGCGSGVSNNLNSAILSNPWSWSLQLKVKLSKVC